ncbi:MAG: hypothetical protein Crog4KO_19180 [Crocinitomicaceae bacterium]
MGTITLDDTWQDDSLVCSFEDYLGAASSDERNNFENIYGDKTSFIYFLDKETEVRRMLELFGDTLYTPYYDSVIFPRSLSQYLDRYIGNYSWDFDQWEPTIVSVQNILNTKINTTPFVTEQAWSSPSMYLEYDGFMSTMNYPDKSPYYNPIIDSFLIASDGFGSLFVQERDNILNQITVFPSWDQNRYQSYLLFLYNMLSKKASITDILTVANKLTDDITRSDQDDVFKAEILVSANKILTATNENTVSNLVAKNFGYVYSYLSNDRDKFNNVRLMEIEFLNHLGSAFPFRNLIGEESLNIFRDIHWEVDPRPTPLVFHLSLAEIAINELYSLDEIYDYETLKNTEINTLWRLVILLEEIERREQIGEMIPTYIYDRTFDVISFYVNLQNDPKKLVNYLLRSLERQKISTQKLNVTLSSLSLLIWSSEQNENGKAWLNIFEAPILSQLELDMLSSIGESSAKNFGDRNDQEKQQTVMAMDNLVQYLSQLIHNKNSVDELNEIFSGLRASGVGKKQSEALLAIGEFCFRQKEYEKAYIFNLVGENTKHEDFDVYVYGNYLKGRNTSESTTTKRRLQNQNYQLGKTNQSLKNSNLELAGQISKQEEKLKTLQSQKEQLEQDTEKLESDLHLKEALIAKNESEIRNQKYEIRLLEDRRTELQQKYGTEKSLRESVVLRNTWLWIGVIILLFFLLGIIILLYRSVKRRKVLKENNIIIAQQKALVEEEKNKVEQEQRKTKALQLSIGQITHLCKDGVDNLLRTYFQSKNPDLLAKGKKALNALVDSFQLFHENKDKFTQSLKDEIALADIVCQFQNPEFSKEFAPSKLSIIRNRFFLANREVPIYTVVNLMSNVIRHSQLNDELEVIIEKKELENGSTLVIKSQATLLNRSSGRPSTGTQYICSMVDLLVDGRKNEFTHGPLPDGSGYQALLPINS